MTEGLARLRFNAGALRQQISGADETNAAVGGIMGAHQSAQFVLEIRQQMTLTQPWVMGNSH
jgi:hypothetical protein